MGGRLARAGAACMAALTACGAICAQTCSLEPFREQRARIQSQACALARQAVSHYLRSGRGDFKGPDLPDIFDRRAAVFVTISKAGQRRGCRGSFEPSTDSLKNEIIQVAIQAATADVRYRPIRLNELSSLTFSVSIVGQPRRVKDLNGYSPARYGVLLRSGEKSGVLLPGEAKTNSWQLSEVKRQAGLEPGEPYELYVFETVALHEASPTGDR